MEKSIVTKILILISMLCLVSCTNSSPSVDAFDSAAQLSTNPVNHFWQAAPIIIWNKIQPNSRAKLFAMKAHATPEQAAWIDLALISKQNKNSNTILPALIAWKQQNPSHPANQLLPDLNSLSALQTLNAPRQIAVLLPEHGSYSASAQNVREGFLHAYYANLSTVNKQNVKFYDTQSKNILALYQQVINEGADFVIGPLTKDEVQQLSQSNDFKVPILALNYSNTNQFPMNVYEFGLLPEDETIQMVKHARAQGLSKAIIIASPGKWGERLIKHVSNQWQALGGSIQEVWTVPQSIDLNSRIAQLMRVETQADPNFNVSQPEFSTPQIRQDFDVIFLFLQTNDAQKIVPLLHNIHADNVPIYATSSAYERKRNISIESNLNGTIICDIPSNASTETANRLNALGQDAYFLSQKLAQLNQLPNFPVYGATGALFLTASHQIHRRVPCSPIRYGFL